MDTQTVQPTPPATSTPPPSEPVQPPQPEPVEAPVSIADHASQFHPTKEREPANTGQFDRKAEGGRHKAASQRATPEDVAEINRLTKELRTKAADLLKVKPDATGGSPRLTVLRRQIKAIEAELSELQPKPEPVKAAPVAPAAPPKAPEPFTDKEPQIEDFQNDPAKYPDPYSAWMRAATAFDRKREANDASQAEVRQQQEAQARAEHERLIAQVSANNARVQAFAATTPDFHQATAALQARILPPVLLHAVIRHDSGPQFMYHLAQHPELVDELAFITEGKPLTDASVAYVQRRLAAALSSPVASTGSTARTRPIVAPPQPPNPVRTGPGKATDEPPGPGASIAEHTRYYSPKRR
jgi:hypothetical protein